MIHINYGRGSSSTSYMDYIEDTTVYREDGNEWMDYIKDTTVYWEDGDEWIRPDSNDHIYCQKNTL